MDRQAILAPLAVILLILGVVLFKASNALYTFVFLPDFHGSWRDAIAQGLLATEGWWAFTKSTPGLIMRGGGLASFLGCWLCWRLALRDD